MYQAIGRVIDFLDSVRAMIVLGCVIMYVQARWHLWERWKKDTPEGGPFSEGSDVI